MLKLLLAAVLLTPVVAATTACGQDCGQGYYTHDQVEKIRADLLDPPIPDPNPMEYRDVDDPVQAWREYAGLTEDQLVEACAYLAAIDWEFWGSDKITEELDEQYWWYYPFKLGAFAMRDVYDRHLTLEEQHQQDEFVKRATEHDATDYESRAAIITIDLLQGICGGC